MVNGIGFFNVSVAQLGLPSVLWFTTAGLFATALSARFVPGLAQGPHLTTQKRKVIEQDWLVLLRQPAFVRMVLAGALVLVAMPCIKRSPSYAGVMPVFPLLCRACFGQNRLERRCWFLFSLVLGQERSIGFGRWRSDDALGNHGSNC
jgi:hypothetical protein